jgi:hypothetical protein
MSTGRLGAAASGAWATPPHLPGPQDSLRDYEPAGAADAAAEPPAQQDLPGTTGRQGAADAAADSAGATVPSEELRAGQIHLCVDYAGVHRGKRTTLPGAG